MIDLRWFIPQTKSSFYDRDTDEAHDRLIDGVPRLQYRELRPVRNMKAREWRDDARVERWTDWLDIPTVKELE